MSLLDWLRHDRWKPMKDGMYQCQILDTKYDEDTGDLIVKMQVMGGPNDGRIILSIHRMAKRFKRKDKT